ncbi:tape measure protein [Enterococcus raffinosus]|uniref:phage tail protein n=1 Tax=Escherichia coli TaxID=562 RepID=UPI0007F5336A|nr:MULTISPECIES: tape measure protein [Enterococcus]MDK7992824.1 tape measure protein [Enterococcus raffinosus]SAM73795.1 phage tail tape measure protein, TP901 family, core region [Enterococcus faecium]
MNDDLILKMILDESGFSAGMNSAVKKLGSFDNTVSNTGKKGGNALGSIWKVFAGSFLASGATKLVGAGFDLIKGSISGAIDRVDTMNNAVRNFKNMGFEDSEINRTIGKGGTLSQGIQGLPTALNDAISQVQLLASSTGDLGRSDQIFRALNDGILGFGGTTDQVNEAVIQLSQSFSNGKVDAQTWNSMINAQLGPTLSAIAKKMNLSMGELKEGLSKGTISVKDFQDQLIEMDTKGGGGLKSLNQIAKDSTKGIKTSIQNAKTAVTRGVGEVIEAMNKVLVDSKLGGFKGIIDGFGNAMETFLGVIAKGLPKAVEFLGELIKDLIKFGSALKFILPFLVPAATAFGAFMFQLKGIPAIIKNFNNLKNAITGIGKSLKIMGAIAAANPFVLIVGAIVGAIAVFGYFMATNEEFRNKVIAVWNDVKKVVLDTLVAIKDWGLKTWDSIKEVASKAATGIKNVWSGVKEWFSNLWNSIKETASNAWQSFKTVVVQPIAEVIQEIVSVFSSIVEFLVGIWTNLIEIGGSYFEILKNVILAPILFVTSMITGGWSETRDNMIAVWNNIKENALNIWNSIKNLFTIVTGAMVSVGKIIWNGFKTELINLWNFIKASASLIWNSIKAFFVATWNAIKTTATNTWNAIKDTMINTWNSIKQNFWNIVSGIVQSAENAWTNLKNGVSNAVDRVWNTFDSLRKINLFEIGRNIIQGLIDGITEKANAVVQKVQSIAGSIKKTITNALDIHSPSRWMRDMVGKNIVQGIIVGLDKEQPELDKAMTDLVPTPSVTPTVRSLTNRPVGVTQTKTESQSTEVHLHLNVYGDLPDSVVKKLAAKLKTEFTKQMKRDADAVGGMA